MEKKKNNKKVSNKTSKKNTSTKKKTTITEKKTTNKKKKGFTLIELLAVIIILGILMIIAIPSVTKYISDSRKSAYVDTAKEVVSGTRNIVNEGKLGMYDTNTTYYIPAKYVNTENSLKSPYGEFTDTSAYVGVIYDGTGYKYYWISADDAGQGIDEIIAYDKLDEDYIKSDLNPNDILDTVETTGIGSRTNIKILSMEGTWRSIVLSDTSNNVSEDGDGSLDTSGPRYVYFTIDSNESLYIGEELPSSAIVYDSYQEAMDSWGIDFCTKLKIDNNIITEGYIVFKYNNTLYTVKGGTQGASYQSNADVFRSAFGDSNCTEDECFHCNTTDNFGVSMNFFGDDFIINKNNTQNCFIQDDNLIGCSPYW